MMMLVLDGRDHSVSLLASLDFLQHFLAHILCKPGLELVFFYLADLSVVETFPHNEKLLDFFGFALFLSELLDKPCDFSSKLDQLLA